jgi:tetratricopeptide (TPR) repeat protein
LGLLLVIALAGCAANSGKSPDEPLEIPPDLRYQTGLHMLGKGNREQAAREFEAVLKELPDHLGALEGMGLVNYGRGRYKEAVGYFEKALALDPERADTRVNLAATYIEVEQWQKALDESDRVLGHAEYANRGAAWYNKGVALRHLGRLDDATECLRQAIRLVPRFDRAYCELGQVYDLQGHTRLAIAQYERCLTANPANVMAHYYLGILRLKGGDDEGAREAFEKVIELSPASDYAAEVGRYLAALEKR